MNSRTALLEELGRIGSLADDEIDVADAALIMGALDLPEVPLESYRAHLAEIALTVRTDGDKDMPLTERVALINAVLFERFGYAGDTDTYDDVDNANLLRVIDRRRGLPVSLGILYLHATRALGCLVSGLAFPGHFLVRLDEAARRIIVDPFHRGQALEAGHLRDLLKQFLGPDAELQPVHYAPVGNRAVLLRLQNNLKTRALDANDTARAVELLERMVMFAPEASGVWHELGVLLAHLGNLKRAVRALETFLDTRPAPDEERQAAALLQKLKSSLN